MKYIDEEILQDLFANLLISSMDNRMIIKVHPAFVSYINQMDYLDAILIKCFVDNPRYNVVRYLSYDNISFPIIYSVLGLDEGILKFDNSEITISLNNLCRMGLISINFNYTHDMILKLLDRYNYPSDGCDSIPFIIGYLIATNNSCTNVEKENPKSGDLVFYEDLTQIIGEITITHLGYSFLSVCVNK